MDRVFSVDEIGDPFMWPSSPNPSSINRNTSQWYLDKFLEIDPDSPAAPVSILDSNPAIPPPVVVGSNFDAVETKKPEIGSGVADLEHVAQLKQKLNMYCAVARNAIAKPKDTVSVADCSSPGSDASQLAFHATGKGGGSNGFPAPAAMQNSSIQGVPANSASSRELSDDDDLEGDDDMDNLDPSDVKKQRRMLSNRESARRSRRRKQAHLTELETQVGQLNVENSTLLKRLTDINQKYSTAAVDNRILKADVETLRAKVKMAEESVKRVTGVIPLYPTMSGMSSMSLPFNGSPSDATSDSLPIQDDPNFYHVQQPHDRGINTRIPEIASVPPVGNGDNMHGAVSVTKMNRTAAMPPVAGTSVPWENHAWSPETSANNKQN